MTENEIYLHQRIDALSMECAALAVRVAKLEASQAIQFRPARPAQDAQWEASLARLRALREERLVATLRACSAPETDH